LTMCDAEGQPRIALSVDPDGGPRLELLDADGDVAWSAPGEPEGERPSPD
jgi:hypothetical protein